jgi:serine protease Do
MHQTKPLTRQSAEVLSKPVVSKVVVSIAASVLLAVAAPLLGDDRWVVDASVLAAQQQRVDVMREASAATISIFGLEGDGGGSGVIVTPDGYALTNYHVSSACGDHMRCGLNDGTLVDAVIVGIDATGDVALIKLLGRDDFPTAQLADSDQVRIGQWCFAAGNPFVLATNLQPSVSLGIVSGVNRYQYPSGTLLEYADCIQTDAAVNPGNSGGPLFDLTGNVIGINGRCSFEKRGRVNVGVGYAISANQIKYFMGALRSGRLVDHATLGATVSTDDTGKVLVSNILNGSDAYRRGLRYGDEVVRLADREVKTTNMFKNILGTLPKDWRVPLEIRRENQTQVLLVRLDGVHTEKQLIDLVAIGLGGGPEKPEDPQPSDELSPPEDAPVGEPRLDESGVGEPDKKLVSSMLETRAGFANYYFNRLKRESIWQQLQVLGRYAEASRSWGLTGTLAGESTPVSILTAIKSGKIQIGSRVTEVNFKDAMSDVVAARREGGLLLALQALQELLQLGPEKLGASTYLGTFPVYQTMSTQLATQPRHDVLETLWYDAQVRFSMDPSSGRPSLIEVFGDVGQDPVEVYLDNYKDFEFDGGSLPFPSRVRLQYGVEPLILIAIDKIAFGKHTTRDTTQVKETP